MTGGVLTRRLLDGLLMLVISFALGEIVLRVYNGINPVSIFYDDSYNRFRGKALSYNYDFRLNSKGFKDMEFDEDKGDRFRIAGIGDSFAFAVVPYESAYLTLLEDRLNSAGRPVEVLNMGIPGTGPRDYLALLVNEGLELDPDMALISFFIGNDLMEGEKAKENRELYTYSHVASLLRYVLFVQPKHQGMYHSSRRSYTDGQPQIPYSEFLIIERRRSYIYIEDIGYLPKRIKTSLHYLEQIHSICGRRDIATLIIIIPDILQLDPGLQRDVERAYKKEIMIGQELDLTRPNEMLTEGLDRMGLAYIDLYEPFLKASRKQALYIPHDSHWNIAGNRLAAKLIAEGITKIVDSG